MNYCYFAYGSNLLTAQMVARTGAICTGDERPRIARLPNYQLVFNMLGEDGRVYANIVTPGDGVLGVVYRCGREALEKLDRFERGYERQKVLVIDEQGTELGAIAYVALADNVVAAGRPSAEYWQKIKTGAREHGLPEEYIRAIELSI